MVIVNFIIKLEDAVHILEVPAFLEVISQL
jgi:hypothetical protein